MYFLLHSFAQINLQFDPVVFEDPAFGVRVHRGVYEVCVCMRVCVCITVCAIESGCLVFTGLYAQRRCGCHQAL